MRNTITNSAVGVGKVLSILKEVARTSASAKAFVNFLGWKLPPGLDEIGLTGVDLTDFLTKLRIVLESSETESDDEVLMAVRTAELASAVGQFVQDIHRFAVYLPTQLAGQGDYVSRTNIHKELPRRTFDLLLTGYLSGTSPLLSALLHLMNIFEFKHFEADETIHQVEHIRAIVHYNHLQALLSDPSLDIGKKRTGGALQILPSRICLTESVRYFVHSARRFGFNLMDRRAEEILLGRVVSEDEADASVQLVTHLYEQMGDIGGLLIGLSLFGARLTAPNASDGGIGLFPIIRGQADGEIPRIHSRKHGH